MTDLRTALTEAMGEEVEEIKDEVIETNEGSVDDSESGENPPSRPEAEVAEVEPSPDKVELQGMTPAPKSEAPKTGYEPPVKLPKEERPPSTWKPEAKAKWNELPPEVRKMIWDKESEFGKVFQQTTEDRKFAQAVHQTLEPYKAMIQGEGSDPVRAIASLFQTASALRTAPPQTKAQLVASMVQSFGIDVQMLDSALAGITPQYDPVEQQVQMQVQQQLAPYQQQMQMFQQQQAYQEQVASQQAQSQVEEFIESMPYAEDVRQEMADLIEVAHRRGQSLTLKQAYDVATYANPTIRGLLEQQNQVQQMQKRQQQAQLKKQSSVSLSGAPNDGGYVSAKEPDSIRGAIEQAFLQNQR